jgi:hypothetical protein
MTRLPDERWVVREFDRDRDHAAVGELDTSFITEVVYSVAATGPICACFLS